MMLSLNENLKNIESFRVIQLDEDEKKNFLIGERYDKEGAFQIYPKGVSWVGGYIEDVVGCPRWS